MPRRSRRDGRLLILLVALFALVCSSSAFAAVTQSTITTPADPFFALYDHDNSAAQTFSVSGTSDGTTPDTVDIDCTNTQSDGSVRRRVMLPSVAVNADGTFGPVDVDLSNCTDWNYVLRAVPHGLGNSDPRMGNFTGPRYLPSYTETYDNTGAPGGHQLYDFYYGSNPLGTSNEYVSASDCGLEYQALFTNAALNYIDGLWNCNSALFNNYSSGFQGVSEIRVDGHSAYTPTGAEYINQTAAGLPVMVYSYSRDPLSNLVVIHERDPLVFCADGSGNVVDPDPNTYPDGSVCQQFVDAGAQLDRTWTESQGGRVTTQSDDFSATDAAQHSLETAYDNEQDYWSGDPATRFPGDSGFVVHSVGETPGLGSAAPGTIYAQYNTAGGDSGPDQSYGALTFLTQPDRALFVSDSNQEFQLQYARTIPASGAVNISHVYSSALSLGGVQAMGQAAQGASSAPSVKITSPADKATVSTDAVTVQGTASDDVGVASLKVNGITTAVGAGGTWSQTVPLSAGANTISAVATDSGANSSTASETVTYSPPAAPSCTVPKLAGQTQAAATAALAQAGCTTGAVTAKPSAKVAKGLVVSQTSPAGAKVPAFFLVGFVVSSGAPQKVTLLSKRPRLVGRLLIVKFVCPPANGPSCNGTVKVRSLVNLVGSHRTLGTGSFQGTAGKARSVGIRVSPAFAKAIHKKGSVRAVVSIITRASGGSARTSKTTITIKG